MSSSSTVTGPWGRSTPRRSTRVMALSSQCWISPRAGQTGGGGPPAVRGVALVLDLVQELVDRRAEALQPARLDHAHIGIADVPPLRRDLVRDEVVLGPRVANPRPALPGGVDDVQVVGDLRDE